MPTLSGTKNCVLVLCRNFIHTSTANLTCPIIILTVALLATSVVRSGTELPTLCNDSLARTECESVCNEATTTDIQKQETKRTSPTFPSFLRACHRRNAAAISRVSICWSMATHRNRAFFVLFFFHALSCAVYVIHQHRSIRYVARSVEDVHALNGNRPVFEHTFSRLHRA